MLPLSYSLTPILLQDLSAIDNLRIRILTANVSRSIIRKIGSRESLICRERLTALISVGSNRRISRTNPKTIKQCVDDYLDTKLRLIDHWSGNPARLDETIIRDILHTLTRNLDPVYRTIPYAPDEMSAVLNYIQSSREHPVVNCALIAAPLFHNPLPQGLMLHGLLSEIILSQGGFSLSGMSSWEDIFLAPTRDKDAAMVAWKETANANPYIQAITRAVRAKMESLALELSQPIPPDTGRGQNRIPMRGIRLLNLMSESHPTITNGQVRKLLRISQATASRLLTELVKTGELATHGRGRAVFYTRVR